MNTHMGPHRRLWMGPQFQFKHYSDGTLTNFASNNQLVNTDLPKSLMNFTESDLKSLSYVSKHSLRSNNHSFSYLIGFNGRNPSLFTCQALIQKFHQLISKWVPVVFKYVEALRPFKSLFIYLFIVYFCFVLFRMHHH